MPIPRPIFTHPVFDRLYERDYFIDDAVLREILALGPDAAVPELLKITTATLAQHAAVQRTDYFHNFYFLHALYLLHELRAPEALDVYARLLRLDSESTDYWFGDYLAEEVPDMLAQAAHTRLPELLALLEDARLPLLHRLIPAAALMRLVRAQPEQRPAISAFLQQYLRGIIAHGGLPSAQRPPKSAAFDSDLDSYLGLLLADIQDADLRELEPELRELHRLGLVDESIAGGEADINYEDPNPPQPVPDIFTRYQQLRADPDNYSPFHPDAAALARRRAEEEARYAQLRREALVRQPQVALPKVGRNDPCFCGSGKKFKKCHGA